MKKHSYFLLIGVIFGILTYYLGDKVIAPFDESGMLNTTNILIMGIFVDITVISIFTFLHISIDKLFRQNNLKETTAIRRAILITLLVDFLAFLRIFRLWSIVNLFLALGIIIFIEMFFQTAPAKVEELNE